MLRVQQLQQRLAAAAAGRSDNSAAAAVACPMFPVPSLSLLSVACAGTSAQEAYDLEGLEFLGDVVLKFLATNYLLQVLQWLPALKFLLECGEVPRNVVLKFLATKYLLQLQPLHAQAQAVIM